MEYPPPWELVIDGVLLQSLSLVEVDRVRRFVPPGLKVVPVVAGRTAAGIYYARYGPGSVVEYNELGVFTGIVSFEGRTGVYVARMYVDSEQSLRLAHERLGLPKEMAEFEREAPDGATILVRQGAKPICTLSYGRQFYAFRKPMSGYAFGMLGSEVVRFRGEWDLRLGVTRARIGIPPESPLHSMGLDRPLVVGCGKEGRAMLGADLEVLGSV